MTEIDVSNVERTTRARITRAYSVALIGLGALALMAHMLTVYVSEARIHAEADAHIADEMAHLLHLVAVNSGLAASLNDPVAQATALRDAAAARTRLAKQLGRFVAAGAMDSAGTASIAHRLEAALETASAITSASRDVRPGPLLRLSQIAQGGLSADLEAHVTGRRAAASRVSEQALMVEHGIFATTLSMIAWCAIFVFRPLARDVGERAKALLTLESERAHSATHDPLTGLPNRAALIEHLDAMLAQAHRQRTDVAVIQIDLDRFRAVNEVVGLEGGDAVLVQVAKALRAEVRKGDYVARLSGDEFIAVNTHVEDPNEVLSMANRIAARFAAPIPFKGQNCDVNVSMGVAFSNGLETHAERMIANAGIALYQSRNLPGSRVRFFEDDMRIAMEAREKLRADVRAGLHSDQFEPFLQPQIDARTGEAIGFEALARWRTADRGVLSPGAFLSAAEEAGVMNELGDVIARRTIETLADWRSRDLPCPSFGLNFSEEQLSQPDAVDRMNWLLDSHDLAPRDISIEILETVLIDEDDDVCARNIRRFARAGYGVDLDDFGTGRAALANLRRLSATRIKIDRSFISGIDADEDKRALTGAIIDLARRLRMDVIAEGVETAGERDTVLSLGCHAMQGFLFSPPLSAADAADWLAERNSELSRAG